MVFQEMYNVWIFQAIEFHVSSLLISFEELQFLESHQSLTAELPNLHRAEVLLRVLSSFDRKAITLQLQG